jgi:hypothetical protein
MRVRRASEPNRAEAVGLTALYTQSVSSGVITIHHSEGVSAAFD